MSLYYDLHIHTCLSPCADDDMTPPNLVNMAVLAGLEVIAVTNHNSTRNAGAVMEAARGTPLVVVPGMEVSTAEEIHVICLFPGLEAAREAGREIESLLPPVPNRPNIFGSQLVMDAGERVLEEAPTLLLNAAALSIDRMPDWAASYGGICYPAHIDRPSGGILAVLGGLPEVPVFRRLEVARPREFFADPAHAPLRESHEIIVSSDAHRLRDIADARRRLEPADWPELSPLFAGR